MRNEASTTGPDRRPWWEQEHLPVPPPWGLDHPDHSGHKPEERPGWRRRTSVPRFTPKDFGL